MSEQCDKCDNHYIDCQCEIKELKAQLEKAHKFIFENYPDHFKAWSVKNVK